MRSPSTLLLLAGVLTAFFTARFAPPESGPAVYAFDPATTASPRQPSPGPNASRPGLQHRTPWTTSKFRGRPEPPPPFRAERIYPKLHFKETTVLTSAPGTRRMFVGERTGKIFSIPGDPQSDKADLFLDAAQLPALLNRQGKPPVSFDALYGLTFDPQFEKNRYCYVCYVVRGNSGGQHPEGTRVSRFRVTSTDPPRCEPESETLIIAWLHGGHNGGCLKFGPDGYLYISSGDGGNAFPPDGLNAGQDMSRLLSKILRIDVHPKQTDPKPVDPKPADKPYVIPSDNPFVSLDKARGETWAYGLRNPWKMSFDRQTGDLWVGDVGWELWELVFRVRKGDNYGWSLVEGRQPVHVERQRGPTPIVPPTIEIPHTEGASVTGGFVYRGKKFPELVGHYVFGDWETRRIWGVKVNGDQLGERYELVEPTVRIVDFAEDQDGELYLLDHDDGSIYTLSRNNIPPSQHPFPRKLSETGLFQSVADHRVADGVLAFSINSEQWADHAQAERFLAVPGSGSIKLHTKPRQVAGSMFSRSMDFPTDTVLVKTLSVDMIHGDSSSRRRIETQVLHFDSREWQAYTYEWNDAQTDATLVDRMGKNRTLQVTDPQAPGGRRLQTWKFASRMECIRCHNPWSEYTLAFNVPQLNRPHNYGSLSDNQLRTYRHIGLLEDVFDQVDPLDPLAKNLTPKPVDELSRLANPFDPAANLNDRGRSYLHVNCGHCHRFNGGGSSFIYLQHDLPLKEIKAVNVRPTQGTFGIRDAQIIAPGDPFRSVLYFRLAKAGPGHMPHLGAKLPDERGLALIHDWIRQLPLNLDDASKLDQLITLDEQTAQRRDNEDKPRLRAQLARAVARRQMRDTPTDADFQAAEIEATSQQAGLARQRNTQRISLVEELLSTPPRALQLATAIRQRRLPAATQQLVIEMAMKSPELVIRDLFESFVPEEQRTKRLGDIIVAAELLKLSGDVERGRQLFHESASVQCRSCHRIQGKGVDLGPDLSQIGKKYDRAKLLESIVQPSLNIEPKYATWLVETKSGMVFSGLLVKKDDKEIILNDGKNEPRRIATENIEGLFPQSKSLMPDLLVRDFTPQQLADLLSYLSSLK